MEQAVTAHGTLAKVLMFLTVVHSVDAPTVLLAL